MCIKLFMTIIKNLLAFMYFDFAGDFWVDNVWSDVKIGA